MANVSSVQPRTTVASFSQYAAPAPQLAPPKATALPWGHSGTSSFDPAPVTARTSTFNNALAAVDPTTGKKQGGSASSGSGPTANQPGLP